MEIRRPIGDYLDRKIGQGRNALALCAGFYQRLTQFIPFMKLGKVDQFYTIDRKIGAGADITGDITSEEVINYIPENSLDVITFNSCVFTIFIHEESLNLNLLATYAKKLKPNGMIIMNNMEGVLIKLSKTPFQDTYRSFRKEFISYVDKTSKTIITATPEYKFLTELEVFLSPLKDIGVLRIENRLIGVRLYTILHF